MLVTTVVSIIAKDTALGSHLLTALLALANGLYAQLGPVTASQACCTLIAGAALTATSKAAATWFGNVRSRISCGEKKSKDEKLVHGVCVCVCV